MKKVIKVLLIIVGLISFALGSLGVVLPILPTVPFLLLSSVCFAKGSDRFNNWFTNTKIYKEHMENFVKEKEHRRRIYREKMGFVYQGK